jgi:hypothetical protein
MKTGIVSSNPFWSSDVIRTLCLAPHIWNPWVIEFKDSEEWLVWQLDQIRGSSSELQEELFFLSRGICMRINLHTYVTSILVQYFSGVGDRTFIYFSIPFVEMFPSRSVV